MKRPLGAISALPPFPFESEAERLLGQPAETAPAASREFYLDLAEAIVNQAAAWLDERGVLIDPVEGHDERWRGATVARFVCPAAILLRERGRQDLLDPCRRAMTQLARGVLRQAAGGDVGAGVLDLVMKEIASAFAILRNHASGAETAEWRAALAALPAQTVYKGVSNALDAGRRPTNYGVSAPVGEWFRLMHGLSGDRAWMDGCLAFQMPFFTEHGLYRDPNDPALYDLMVRQNLSELMRWGYDGEHRGRIEELLRRGGVVTLMMLSPTGHAPYGGRSNAMLHNEAMLAYICEWQASAWMAAGRPHAAAAFKEAASRAAAAVAPYARQEPMRFVRNRFAPETRHGKEKGYGEYANYALLCASLFARLALAADDSIPAARASAAANGCVVNLWPAFHRIFATQGPLHVEIDTRCQPDYDATGLGRFHAQGAPAALALGMGIPAEPKYVVHDAITGRAASIGPCWRSLAGEWQSLARMSAEIEDVRFERLAATARAVSWRVVWLFASGAPLPVTQVAQTFTLAGGRLVVEASAQGVFDRFGFEIPCLVTDGGETARVTTAPTVAEVVFRGWRFRAEAPEAEKCVVEDAIRANREASYRVARFEAGAAGMRVVLTLSDGVIGGSAGQV